MVQSLLYQAREWCFQGENSSLVAVSSRFVRKVVVLHATYIKGIYYNETFAENKTMQFAIFYKVPTETHGVLARQSRTGNLVN